MIRIILLNVVILLFSHTVHAASVYQCKDEKGRVTLSDVPCLPNSATEKVTPMDRDQRAADADRKLYGITGLRTALCDAHRNAIRTLDERLIAAYKRNDLAEQKRISEDRRRWGETMTKYGC